MRLLFYEYNDMSNLFIRFLEMDRDVSYFPISSEYYIDIIDFGTKIVNYSLIKVFGLYSGYWLLILLFFLLSFIFGTLFFKKIINKEGFVYIFSLLYSANLYFFYRIFSFTPNLFFVFLFPLVTYFLHRRFKGILIALLILSAFLLSSYYGFFLFTLVILWYLSSFIVSKKTLVKRVRILVRKLSLIFITVILGSLLVYKDLLINHVPLFGKYQKLESMQIRNQRQSIYRSIEDYYNFSFRPWYFVIPPESSVFFGEFSDRWLKAVENTGYYLADDYAAEEMAGAYMGWHFLLGLVFVGYLLLVEKFKGIKYDKFKSVYKNKRLITRSFLIIFLILLISGPPSFTISGVEIYTPSYLLYYLAPVFRVLTRWAVVIYLFVLIINSFLVQDLYDLMKNKFQKVLFIIGFVALNFVIFAIKLPVINLNKPPHEIAYFDEITDKQVKYAVYPSADYYSIFWILAHENYLVNPRDYENPETGFDSEEFSEQLITAKGINEFKEMGGQYLIYYENRVSEDDIKEISNELNPEIKKLEDLRSFFENNFGKVVYNEGEVLIYERK